MHEVCTVRAVKNKQTNKKTSNRLVPGVGGRFLFQVGGSNRWLLSRITLRRPLYRAGTSPDNCLSPFPIWWSLNNNGTTVNLRT